MGFKDVTQKVGVFIKKNSPQIMVGFGITGFITSTIMAVKVTPNAKATLERLKHEKEKLTFKDKWKVAKYYVPAAVVAGCSTACCVGSVSISMKRNAVLATALGAAETTLSNYQKSVIEKVGEETFKEIKSDADKKTLEQQTGTTVTEYKVEQFNGKYDTFDCSSFRMCPKKMSEDDIRKIENDINEDIFNSMSGYKTLNDYYDYIGLDETSIGDTLFWDINHRCKLKIDSCIVDNIPRYSVTPTNFSV